MLARLIRRSMVILTGLIVVLSVTVASTRPLWSSRETLDLTFDPADGRLALARDTDSSVIRKVVVTNRGRRAANLKVGTEGCGCATVAAADNLEPRTEFRVEPMAQIAVPVSIAVANAGGQDKTFVIACTLQGFPETTPKRHHLRMHVAEGVKADPPAVFFDHLEVGKSQQRVVQITNCDLGDRFQISSIEVSEPSLLSASVSTDPQATGSSGTCVRLALLVAPKEAARLTIGNHVEKIQIRPSDARQKAIDIPVSFRWTPGFYAVPDSLTFFDEAVAKSRVVRLMGDVDGASIVSAPNWLRITLDLAGPRLLVSRQPLDEASPTGPADALVTIQNRKGLRTTLPVRVRKAGGTNP